MTIRHLTTSDWKIFKSIRLEALKTDPQAFGSTFKDESTKEETYWKACINDGIRGSQPSVIFCAFHDDRPFGVIFAFRDQRFDEVAHLAGLWVKPAFRGQKIATKLLQAALEWSKKQHFEQAKLWNNVRNTTAQTLYEKEGFQYTERTDTMKSHPNQTIREMRKDLSN